MDDSDYENYDNFDFACPKHPSFLHSYAYPSLPHTLNTKKSDSRSQFLYCTFLHYTFGKPHRNKDIPSVYL